MTSQISILIYGFDPQLLLTRQLVLQRAGYWVVKTTELVSLAQLIPLEQIDLLILCHTLTTEQCQCAVSLVDSRWPQVKTLVLTAGHFGCPSLTAAQVLDAMEGPVKLLTTVSRLVHAEPGISLVH